MLLAIRPSAERVAEARRCLAAAKARRGEPSRLEPSGLTAVQDSRPSDAGEAASAPCAAAPESDEAASTSEAAAAAGDASAASGVLWRLLERVMLFRPRSSRLTGFWGCRTVGCPAAEAISEGNTSLEPPASLPGAKAPLWRN